MQFKMSLLVLLLLTALVVSTPVDRVKRQMPGMMGMNMGMGMGMDPMGMGMGMGPLGMGMGIEDFAEPCEMADCLGLAQYRFQRQRLAASRMAQMMRMMGVRRNPRTGLGATGAAPGAGIGGRTLI